MAKRLKQFTQDEIDILIQNPNVEDVTTNTIKYTSEFKKLALEKFNEGISPNDIFKEAGFNLKIIGKHTPNNRIRAWKFYEKNSDKNNTKYLAKEVKKNKILKSILEENKYLKAENEFLKKLQALLELAE